MKKMKLIDLNSDQKRIQNLNRKHLRSVVRSTGQSTAICAGTILCSSRSIGWSIASCAGLQSSFWTIDLTVNLLSSTCAAPFGRSNATCLSFPCALLCMTS